MMHRYIILVLCLLGLVLFKIGFRPYTFNLKTPKHSRLCMYLPAPVLNVLKQKKDVKPHLNISLQDSNSICSNIKHNSKILKIKCLEIRQGTDTQSLMEVSRAKQALKRVLFIGDSELETLRMPMNFYLKSSGMELTASIIWYGSATKHWALTDSLQRYIKHYQPDFVMIALGLNEVHVTDLNARIGYVNSIKSKLDNLAVNYFWIGPACWTKDQGIVAVISKIFNNRFYPSHELDLERGKDGKHPTLSAAWKWMHHVALRLNENNLLELNEPHQIGLNTERPKTIIWPVPKW
jgi:hypothetical protein